MIFTGKEIASTFEDLGITHVVWIPDTETGRWEKELESSATFQLVRVCREGEAWPLAAGLHVGGKVPVVIIQSTGLFESGDALRNVLFDLELPLFAIIGARNWLIRESRDTAKQFVQPILEAWGLDYRVIANEEDKPELVEHFRRCRSERRAGAILLAEGSG